MYEFEIYNAQLNETRFVYGNGNADAFSRHPELNPNDWIIINSEYID